MIRPAPFPAKTMDGHELRRVRTEEMSEEQCMREEGKSEEQCMWEEGKCQNIIHAVWLEKSCIIISPRNRCSEVCNGLDNGLHLGAVGEH
eukprot:158460-Pelagomonas_calceolata.AAC.1